MEQEQKQIEEMVSIMAASNNPFVDVPIEIMPKVAEALYNAGYGNVEEYRTEIERLEKENHNCQIITKDTQMAVKEFAEKLKAKLFYIFGKTICSDFDTEDITFFIDELLKEYGI